jgi:hypothetical protein
LLWTVSTRITRRSIIPSRSPIHGFSCFSRSIVRVPSAASCAAGSSAGAAGAVESAGLSVSPGGADFLPHPAIVMSAKAMLKPNAKDILVFIVAP